MAIEAAEQLWDAQLREIPEEIVRKSLLEVPKRFPMWIPEVGEFYQLCKEFLPSKKYEWFKPSTGYYRQQPHPDYERKIKLGAEIIKRLLLIFPSLRDEIKNSQNKKFSIKSFKASMMLSILKKQAKKFFPDLEDEKLLEEILKFDDEDFKDILEEIAIK